MRTASSIQALIREFAKLPGIGEKSAERMAFFLVNEPPEAARGLAAALLAIKENLRNCSRCNNLSDTDPCAICADPARDGSVICVVERPKDLLALEATRLYNGVYHVLQGHLAPLDGKGPETLQTGGLVRRLKEGGIREVILAVDPDLEGDGTCLYLRELVKPFGLRVTRLARGLPSGSSLEHASRAVLCDALRGRSDAAT
jgi:recombination protein RecR